MSLVIAIKDKNRVVLGSDKQSSTSCNKDHTCTKIWNVKGIPYAVMGGVGSMRANQIIQYNKVIDLNDIAPEGIDTDFIVNSLVPTIIGALKANGVDCTCISGEDKDPQISFIPNVFLFAIEDKAWMIWNDLSVTELNDYLAIGSGADVAMGALYATKKLNPFDRIVTSIEAAAETTLFVDNSIDILATDYLKSDPKLIAKALNVEVVIEKNAE